MKAAVLYAPGDVRIEERDRPEPGPREVLVQITAVGVCGSDVHYYEHGRIGPFVVEAPLVLGHESAGRVVELGEGASKHAVGDRVTLEPGVPCGRCNECRAGRYNLCKDVVFFATPPVDGASRWTAFRRIALPLVVPGIATTAVLCLVFSWNDYAFASTFSGPDSQTLPIAASQLVTQTEIDWGQLTAIGTIVVAPMIVVGLVVRRWLVTGLTLGAVTGE